MRVTSAVLLAVTMTATGSARMASAEVTPSSSGAQLYGHYCQPCHGADRKGYAADNAPSLVSPTFLETASDAFLRSAIARGRAGTAMGGYGQEFGGPLEPWAVEALVIYLRGGAKPKLLPEKRSTGKASAGEPLYRTHCESCHGSPTQRANAVHLANAMFLDTASDAFLRAAIVHGRPGTPMLAWDTRLTPSEIEDIVAYLRSLARPVPPPGAGQLLSLDNIAIVINPKGAQASFTLRENKYVSVADVGKAYKEGRRLVIVDARTPSDYLRMHITGAISIPHFDMRDLARIPNDGTWVIAYCACPHHVSGIVVDELRKRGYPNAAVLDEGIFAWQHQGNPTVVAPGQLPIPAPPALSATPRPRASGTD